MNDKRSRFCIRFSPVGQTHCRPAIHKGFTSVCVCPRFEKRTEAGMNDKGITALGVRMRFSSVGPCNRCTACGARHPQRTQYARLLSNVPPTSMRFGLGSRTQYQAVGSTIRDVYVFLGRRPAFCVIAAPPPRCALLAFPSNLALCNRQRPHALRTTPTCLHCGGPCRPPALRANERTSHKRAINEP